MALNLLDRAGVAAYLSIELKSVDKIRERSKAAAEAIAKARSEAAADRIREEAGPLFPEPDETFARTPLWAERKIAKYQRDRERWRERRRRDRLNTAKPRRKAS